MAQPYDRLPRKIIVGTSIFPHYGPWEGLGQRLDKLGALIDEQDAAARSRYGRAADLMVFTEHAVTGGSGRTAAEKAHPWQGEIGDFFAAKAREVGSNLCLPLHLEEDRAGGIFTNSAVFLDRQGQQAGIYRKLFPVNGYASIGGNPELLESGITPGLTANVIELDFGRVGSQICWDMMYDDGWRELAEAGAELVVWSTASPRVTAPSAKAARHSYWVVSATPRCNAGIYEPVTGEISARIRPPQMTLVHEIDLSWHYSHWLPTLRDGAALTERFGEAVGHSYRAEEDGGLFWSNDPRRTIGEMFREIGIDPSYNRVAHSRQLRQQVLKNRNQD